MAVVRSYCRSEGIISMYRIEFLPRTQAANVRGRAGLASGLTIAEAEELLDWLEVHGYENREVSVLGNRGCAVRWRE